MRPLLLMLMLSCGGVETASTPDQKDQPNIVVFTLDTLRADALGAHGQKKPTSPHIDALAASAISSHAPTR